MNAKEVLRWAMMIDRCYNPENKSYRNYGGRGITVCERWHDYRNFIQDLGEIPEGLSLHRINNDREYSPENIELADRKTQARNRRNTHVYTYKGEARTLPDWELQLGLGRNTLRSRMSEGKSFEDAVVSLPRKTTGAAELSKKTGLPVTTIENRLKKGLQGEQLIKTGFRKTYEYKGKEQNLTQWSEELGISRTALKNRILSGMPVELAFSKPQKFHRDQPLSYNLNGDIKTLKEWSRIKGISYSTLRLKHKNGITAQMALC
jgi:hypothetical protein